MPSPLTEAQVTLWDPLVEALARRLCRLDTDLFGDLCQEGRLALLRALPEYDPTRGVPLHSYLAPRLRGPMLNYLHQQEAVAPRAPTLVRYGLFPPLEGLADDPAEGVAERLDIRDAVTADLTREHRRALRDFLDGKRLTHAQHALLARARERLRLRLRPRRRG